MYEWMKTRSRDVLENGMDGIDRTRHDLTEYAIQQTVGRFRDGVGTPIYEREWDVLVVLDACRLDLMEEVADEYEFIEKVDSIRSVGSHSEAWMQRNFVEEYATEMRSTAHITGNPFSAQNLDPNDFALLDEVWRYAWDDSELQTVLARPMTDRLVAVGREHDADRIICHYMQPHASFVPRPELQAGDGERSVWMEVLHGTYDAATIWEAYRENLRYVLDDVAIALENLDADRVVITSDHGNAIGEWGIYGHPDVPLDVIRTVPWIETTARDSGSHEPETEPEGEIDETMNPAQRLADLGYIEDQRAD